MRRNFRSIKKLIKVGLMELIRDPKTFFFLLIFPLLFLAMFWGMSRATSEIDGLSFFEYMFPGILIFALFSTGIFGTSTPFIEMRNKGTLRLLQTTPLKKDVFIVSQILVRLIIACMQIVLFISIGLLMGIVNPPVIIPIFFVSLLGMGMMLTLGFIIGGLFKSVEIVSGVTGALAAPILILSGVLFPLHMLPGILEKISKLIPFTYLGDLVRSIMFSSVEPMLPIYLSIMMLLGCTVVFYFIARFTFKWEAK